MLEAEVFFLKSVKIYVKERKIENELFYKETKVLTYSIAYPEFLSDCKTLALTPINRFYRDKALKFKRYCEQDLFKAAAEELDYSKENKFPVRPYDAVMAFTVTYNENCVLSLYTDQYTYTGGAHGMPVRGAETFCANSGRRIFLAQLFPPRFCVKDYILGMVNAEIARQTASEEVYYFDDYETLACRYYNPESFYLTPEGIVFFYGLYEIAPYAAGFREFLIPCEER
jgi:hypothetical protein